MLLAIAFNNLLCCKNQCYPIILLLGADVKGRPTFGPGRGPIFLDNVGCIGTEPRLTNCTNLGVGVHNCRHVEDAGVVCSGMQSNMCAQSNMYNYTLRLCKPLSGR